MEIAAGSSLSATSMRIDSTHRGGSQRVRADQRLGGSQHVGVDQRLKVNQRGADQVSPAGPRWIHFSPRRHFSLSTSRWMTP